MNRHTARTTAWAAGLLAWGVLAAAPARGGDPADAKRRGDAAFAAQDWATAAAAYQEQVADQADDGAAWFRLGISHASLGRDAEAIPAFEQALAHGFSPVLARFRLAKSQAASGHADAALASLEQLAALGKFRGMVDQIASAAEFEALRARPELAPIVDKLTPCATEQFRQFDFWLGDWEVRAPQGNVVGTNRVTSRLDECALTEEWTSVTGGRGMSLNWYDESDGLWHQVYIDNTGNAGNWPPLAGGLENGAMVLRSPDDAQPRTRWTWTPVAPHKVRQMAESSSDAGRTWTTVWDSYYVPRGSEDEATD